MNREDLLKAWVRYKEDMLNDMTDYSENDGFIARNEVSDEDFDYLLGFALKVSVE